MTTMTIPFSLLLMACGPKGDDTAPTETQPPVDTAQDWDFDLEQADAKYSSDQSGWDAGRFLDAGDVNGDGERYLLISTQQANNKLGGAYLIYGPHGPGGTMASTGHFLEGDALAASSGRSVALGDTNGDGLDDVLIGAPYDGSASAWLILGPVSDDLIISQMGIRLAGADATYCGHGSDLADVDGDGIADAVVGAYTSDGAGGVGSGAVFVKHGPIEEGLYLPDQADGTLIGEPEATLTGKIVVAGGDVDGDGIGDLLIPTSHEFGGSWDNSAYIVPGPIQGHRSLGDELRVDSTQPNDKAGSSLAMGDVDGDGLDDVMVGSFGTGTVPGAAYVLLAPFTDSLLLSDAQVVVNEDDPGEDASVQVRAGDWDGDGAGDLLIGTPNHRQDEAEQVGAVLLFTGPLAGSYTLSDAQLEIVGQAAGDALSQGLLFQDISGDGLDDLVLGAPFESSSAKRGGAVYVVESWSGYGSP